MDPVGETLARRLQEPLPGAAVAPIYESRPCDPSHYADPPPGVRRAAVLILLCPSPQGLWSPLIQRPQTLSAHAGQISLPGGALEDGETTADAALREFHEEVGAWGHPIELLGSLTPIFIGVSNFLVTPWIGITETRPTLVANPSEVDEIFEVPLSHLTDPANLSSHEWTRDGQSIVSPHFAWKSHRIWGATCMILGELVTVLGE